MASPPVSAKWQSELALKTSPSRCEGPVTSILVSSARGKVAVCAGGALFVREGPPGLNQKQELAAQAPITAAAFSSKGTEVVTGGADGFLKWWQVESGEETCSTQFPLEDGSTATDLAIPHLACCKAGYIAAAAGRLLCIFGPGGEHIHTLTAAGDAVQQLLWVGDTQIAAASGSQVSLWSIAADQYTEVGTFMANPAATVQRVAASGNGRYLAAALDNDTVQVWDTKKLDSTDPILVLTEGIQAPVVGLSWDAGSKLLAVASGGEALVWDVVGAKEGRADRYMCMGADNEGSVTSLAFQTNGSLLVAGTTNGESLVYDSTFFVAGSAADGMVQHVASGKLGVEGQDESITAIAWHNSGYILAGTATGTLAAFKPMAIHKPENADGQRARQEQGAAAQKRGKGPLAASGVTPGAAAAAAAAATAAARPSGDSAGRMQAGWGGEPLMTNGLSMAEQEAASGLGMRGRGRGGRGKPVPAMLQHFQGFRRDGGPSAAAGAAPGSLPAGPQGAGREGGQGVGPGWAVNMVPMAPMWRPMQPMQPMPYMPYGQMVAAPMGAMGAQPMPQYVPVPVAHQVAGPRAVFPGGPRPPTLQRQGSNTSTRTPTAASATRRGSAGMPVAVGGPGDKHHGSGGGGEDYEEAVPHPPSHPPPQQQQSAPPPDNPPPARAAASSADAGSMQRHSSGSGAGGGATSGAQPAMQGRIAVPAGSAMPPGMVPVYMYPPQAGPQWGMSPYPQQWAAMPYGYAPYGPYYPGGAMQQMHGAPHAVPQQGHMMVQQQQGMQQHHQLAQPPQQVQRQDRDSREGGRGMRGPPPQQHADGEGQAGAMAQGSGGGDERDAAEMGAAPPASSSGQGQYGGPRPRAPPSGGYEQRVANGASSGAAGMDDAGRSTMALYVGNLAPSVDENVLFHQFAQFGAVANVQIIRDRETSQPRGFGFVTFAHPMAANVAMQQMNGVALPGPFEGRPVRVSPSNRR